MNKGRSKGKRKVISLETKTKILKRIAAGEGSTALGKEFGLGESTIRGIQKRADEINTSSFCATKESAKRASYSRNILIEKTEKALILWIQELTRKKSPFDGESIKEKAIEFYNELKNLEPSCSSCSSPRVARRKFSASNGWLAGFLQRHALRNRKVSGTLCNESDKSNSKMSATNYVTGITSVQKEPDKLTADNIYTGLQLCHKLERHFLEIDNNFERVSKFQKDLQSCVSGYRGIYNRLVKQQSSKRPIAKTDHRLRENSKKVKLKRVRGRIIK